MKGYSKTDSNNSFVMKEGKKILDMMGDRPGMPAECEKFDACMSNTGEKAANMGRKLSKNMDKKAFPVK